MKTAYRNAVLLLVAMTCVSCASIGTHFWDDGATAPTPKYFYAGTQGHLETFTTPLLNKDYNPVYWCYAMPFCVIDFPFSLVLDTVLLPYDVYKVTFGGEDRCGRRREEPANNQIQDIGTNAPNPEAKRWHRREDNEI